MIIVNQALAIINGKTTAFAAAPVKTAGSGKFREIHKDAIIKTGGLNCKEKRKAHIKDSITGMIASLIDLSGNGSNAVTNKVSICCNSGLEEITKGIVGILEGFELLNCKNGETAMPQEIDNILNEAFIKAGCIISKESQASNTGGALINNEKAICNSPYDKAGTLKNSREDIVNRIAQYMCSFANINKKETVEKTAGNNGGKTMPQAPDELISDTAKAVETPLKAMFLSSYDTDITGKISDNAKTMPNASEAPSDDAAAKDKETSAGGIMTLLKSAAALKKGFKSGNAEALKPVTAETRTADKAETPDKSGLYAAEQHRVQVKPEPVQNPEAKDNAPQASNTNMTENFTRIVKKITAQNVRNEREFEITLKPEFLGRLSIKLSTDGDVLKARLKAADSIVKGLIADELPALTEMLREKGLNVAKIDVTCENPAFEASGRNYKDNSGDNEGGKKRLIPLMEMPDFETAYDFTAENYLAARNSSVEFTA